MTNILLVFTGGTIGSQLENGTIDTDQTAGFKLIRLFRQHDPDQAHVEFKTLQPLQILSENLHPRAWQTVITAIEAQDLSDFDGIIITHGTDTLAFSAAAFGIYFNALNIPVLLVSSDLPLDNPQANGLNNFLCAVEYIRQRRSAGVFVPYQNSAQAMQVHIATRLASCLPLSGDFISVQNKPYLTYEHGEFNQHHSLAARTGAAYKLRPKFATILLIRPYPGLNYAHFNPDNVDIVLHDLYHSGTACASQQWGKSHSLVAFSRRCRKSGIPLYLAPAIQSESAYSSTRQLLEHGAGMIWNTSIETAYAKLAIAYGNFGDSRTIDDFLAQNIACEKV
ncbi:asparaginase domain-containing protein [Methylomonas sp. MgM2]